MVATDASMTLGGVVIDLNDSLGMMDYTRGLLRRFTLWHWLAMSWYSTSGSSDGTGTKSTRYGLQLSEGTYDNLQNVSLESTLCVDGSAYHVNIPIIYTQLDKSVKPQDSQWEVKSADGLTIDLKFTPSDSIVNAIHYYIINGDLYHIWGSYTGSIHNTEYIVGNSLDESIIHVNGVPGTLEDHYAVW